MSVTRWNGTTATKERARLARIVATGQAVCWRCGNPIDPRMAWDVGHIIGRAAGGGNARVNLAPEHASCNRRDGQAVGQSVRRARKRVSRRIRDW